MNLMTPEALRAAFSAREAELKDEIAEDFNRALRKCILNTTTYCAMTFKWPQSRFVNTLAENLRDLGFDVKATHAGTDAHLEVRW